MRYKDEGIVCEDEMVLYNKIFQIEIFKDDSIISYYKDEKEQQIEEAFVLFKNEKHKLKFIEKIKENINDLNEREREEKFCEAFFDWKVFVILIINFCFSISFLLNYYGKSAYVPRILYPIIAIGIYIPLGYLILVFLILSVILIIKAIVVKVKKRKKILIFYKNYEKKSAILN